MHKRTRALSISPKTKREVYDRDGRRCVLCGRTVTLSCASAHYIARSHGGLGIAQNIITLCPGCHTMYDQTPARQRIRDRLRAYLVSIYGEFEDSDLVYQKYENG